ncbi:MAG: hypothetical protein IJB41_02305 [Clostridia bacterium]|nr:hypothetical protein [Clostridia bacterium]
MKMKRFALKGLTILTVVLLVCAFFSGTVRTITTPKVKLTTPKMGKLEEKISIGAKVYFPEVDEIKPELEEGVTLTVKKVNTRAGYIVEKGDVLIEAEVTGYSEKLETLTGEYETAEASLAALERKSTDIRVRSADEEYVRAHEAYQSARSGSLLRRIALDTLLESEGLELEEDGSLPEKAGDELKEAYEEYMLAVEEMESAQKAWDRSKRYSIDETVYAYLTEKAELEKKMEAAEEGIRKLSAANAAASRIVAERDCYAASVDVAAGDVWDGSKPLITLSAKKADPVFRADVTDLERTVSKKAEVTMEGRYGKVESRVNEVVTDTDGRKYAYIDINNDVLDWVGSVYSLMQAGEKEMTLVYKAKEATCLVPVSAVHGSGEDRYVFIVEKHENSFGSTEMTVRKRTVQVETEVEGVASLSEDISWYTLAYMEDRAISDGDRVMEYAD